MFIRDWCNVYNSAVGGTLDRITKDLNLSLY